jgi:dihydrodipicolinate reductase
MIRVCFAGVTGWTAPPIVDAIDAADDISLTCRVSRSAAGRPLAKATASRSDGSIYASVSEALRSAEVDVLVDYTSAAAVKQNVLAAVARARMSSSAPAASLPMTMSSSTVSPATGVWVWLPRATSRSWPRS